MAEVTESYGSSESADPRILRTRRMLMDSFIKLLQSRELEDISVQEIADEATVNRATFYLHYPDKNALLQAMNSARFKELIARRGLSFDNCDGALRAIALGVCDYLSETSRCPGQLAKMPIEGSIIPAVQAVFREGGLKRGAAPGPELDLLATTAAWAIVGAAREWYLSTNRIPAEEMAEKIETIVKPIFLAGHSHSEKLTK